MRTGRQRNRAQLRFDAFHTFVMTRESECGAENQDDACRSPAHFCQERDLISGRRHGYRKKHQRSHELNTTL
jgi:hypothetical protein